MTNEYKNKYLEKIAEKSGKDYAKIGAEGIAGGAIASGASQRILGYHTVYHGTSKSNADSIRKNGFDPKEGGGVKGAGHSHPDAFMGGIFKEHSKGKIHVTKKPTVATAFAGLQSVMKKERPGFVKARVSDKMWQNFKADRDMGGSKPTAATTKHKIGSKFIAGGVDGKGVLPFLKTQRIKRYLSTTEGKNRAIRGLGLLVTGGSLLGHSIKRLASTGETKK